MLEWVRPATFVPVHGEFSFLETHAELARSTGVPCVQVVENGQWFQLENDEITLGHNQPLTRYFHDGMLTGTDHGLGVKERWKLSHTGVIALQVSRSTLSGSRGVTVTLQTEGIPKLDGAFEGRCGAFLEQELAKLERAVSSAEMRVQKAQDKLDAATASSETEEKINILSAALSGAQQKLEKAKARLVEHSK